MGKSKARPNYSYKALTRGQEELLHAIDKNIITFVTGPAGTGKSLLSVARGLDYLFKKVDGFKVKRIILMRPAVECAGERLGSLPGDLEEKIAPYIFPLYDNLCQLIPKATVDELMQEDKIHILPLAFMRGVTFRRAFVVVDEAQNCRVSQMKCILTRMDEHSKIVVTGDLKQSDIHGDNGLTDAIERLRGIKGIGIVRLGVEDIVRAGIIREIIAAYQLPLPDEKDLQPSSGTHRKVRS